MMYNCIFGLSHYVKWLDGLAFFFLLIGDLQRPGGEAATDFWL